MKKKIILLMIAAVLSSVLTYFIVVSDFDWQYFRFVGQYHWLKTFFFPAMVIGGLFPMLFSVVVVSIYWKFRSAGWMQKSSKIFWAIILAVIIDSVMKAITGRPAPVMAVNLIDNSQVFRFGFLRGGVFWGWPSEHTMVAFAMAATFAKLNSEKLWLVFVAYLYAVYIAIGVSLEIHWFSDVVAGILIGYAIGDLVIGWKKNVKRI